MSHQSLTMSLFLLLPQACCPRPRCACLLWWQWARWPWSTSTCWSRACWDLEAEPVLQYGHVSPLHWVTCVSCWHCASFPPVWFRRLALPAGALPTLSGFFSSRCCSWSFSLCVRTTDRRDDPRILSPARLWLFYFRCACPRCFSSWQEPITWLHSEGSRRCAAGFCGWWLTCSMCWICKPGCGRCREAWGFLFGWRV